MKIVRHGFLLLLMVANFSIVYSQDSKLLALPRFRDVSGVSWKNEIYHLPEFQKGSVTLATGFKLKETLHLNYNIYYERMDFLQKSGDTTSIGNPQQVKLIEIGSRTFYHDYKSGYYEVLVESSVSLASKPTLSLVRTEGNCGDVSLALETRGAVMDCDRLYVKKTLLAFIDQNNKIWSPSRASLIKLFPSHRKEILAYLLEQDVDFESEKDVIKLYTYCNELTSSKKEITHGKNSDNIKLTLKARKSLPTDCPSAMLYRLPDFVETKITWVDKSSSFYPLKMNYNFFTAEMDVARENDDTTKFKEWMETEILNMDGQVFIKSPSYGYLEILMQGPLALGVRNRFNLVSEKKILEDAGFLDQAKASDMSNKSAVANYNRLYQFEKTYFFIDQKSQSYEASKLAILRVMTRDRKEVIAFIAEQNISFDNEIDLKKLLSFCNSLLVAQ